MQPFWKTLTISYEVNYNAYIMSSNPTSRHLPKRNVHLCSEQNLYMNVYNNLIHNHQRWKYFKCLPADEWVSCWCIKKDRKEWVGALITTHRNPKFIACTNEWNCIQKALHRDSEMESEGSANLQLQQAQEWWPQGWGGRGDQKRVTAKCCRVWGGWLKMF